MVGIQALYFTAFASSAWAVNSGPRHTESACSILQQTYPNITYVPGDEKYITENEGKENLETQRLSADFISVLDRFGVAKSSMYFRTSFRLGFVVCGPYLEKFVDSICDAWRWPYADCGRG